jgi:NAD(P)-dependent dehydrogenase (short-subunit alcohol dehydrogenase family)
MIKGAAIVTGAASGIGRAIATRLAEDGFDLAINDISRSKDGLESLRDELKTAHPERNIVITIADVSSESEVKEMVDQVVRELGGLDVVSHSPKM